MELMIVVVIISIIAGFAIPAIKKDCPPERNALLSSSNAGEEFIRQAMAYWFDMPCCFH